VGEGVGIGISVGIGIVGCLGTKGALFFRGRPERRFGYA
jgi:hypothetical protein